MKGMIVAPEPLAVEAGARVLMAGGNAVDAAVTCAFTQAIVNPQMCGIGGYALITIQVAGQAHPLLLDAPALAGARVTPGMWREHLIGMNPDGWGFFLKDKVNDLGYQSICTPGTVRGLDEILRRWGTIGWEAAIAPAAELAEAGYIVDTHLANRWKMRRAYPESCSLLDYIQGNAEASRIYLRNGQPYYDGEIIRNTDYAATLRYLARNGAEDFYQGELAARMSADLAANNAFVTADDLKNYTLRKDQPTEGTYRGLRVASSQPPHGGPTLLAILNILEGYNLKALGHNSAEYIWLVSMAMKAAFADRNLFLGDPAFVDVPLAWMTSKERAAEWRTHIDAGKPIRVDQVPSGPPDTTHVTVVDALGNCVALTHSLGMSSGVITPGLGFMYNNSMINFDPTPGGRNSIAPSKGRSTGMAPTIVYDGDRPMLVLGAPGASRIITSVLQVMLNILDFGMTAAEATAAARFDCQGEKIVCHLRIPEYICAKIRERHPVVRIPQSHGAHGLVHAIAIAADGTLQGGADSGASGMALLV